MAVVTIDRLGSALDKRGWGEAAAEDGFAENWDRELFGLDVPPWRWGVVRLIEAAYHAFGGRRIVIGDMGCGAATYARHLLTTGIAFDFHGYDHNEGVLQAAAKRWALLPDAGVRLHCLDARTPHWPIDDATFDVLIWDSTLRFCDDPGATLRESLRTCRGWIVLARTPLDERVWREEVRYYGMSAPSANWHFDEQYFRGAAAESGWVFSPRVGDAEIQLLSRAPLPADFAVQPVFNAARTFHAGYVRERVLRLLAQTPGNWAIYGAGEHSRWLMGILPEPARRRIAFFLDDHASGELHGVPIRKPGSCTAADVAGVLVSSDVLEEKLAAAACKWIESTAGSSSRPAPIVARLYDGIPPGPYDKSLGARLQSPF
ncbi:MAG: class I SAM-dependent methyltransferase [Planctomycetes bacterium]|nr:class I SAM-dependent methyltransferase [Planctomycetota bacterium]